ncbi:hypothetical protein B0H14DRAFT_3428716 [Mycena olivaceomarginata]|nr:hypothetical protein B0H14DRAFT_3428716 [Mycena olivaceomarginata]
MLHREPSRPANTLSKPPLGAFLSGKSTAILPAAQQAELELEAVLYHASLVPANLTDENPYWESPYPSYDAFFLVCPLPHSLQLLGHLRSSWDTSAAPGTPSSTMHPLLSILDPREWAGIVSSYVDGWWQTGYERWVLGLAHRRYPNGTFAFSPPNACSPVDPMGHSCARGMDNNVGFLNAALADAAAAFPAPRRRQHELRHQRLARQQEAAPPLAALIPLLSLPTLPQEECDEVLAIRPSPLPSKIHRNVITSCFA